MLHVFCSAQELGCPGTCPPHSTLHMCPPCPPSDSEILTRQLAGVCRGKSEAWIRAKYSDPCREQTYDLGLLSTVFLLTPLTEHPESPSFSQVRMHHGNTQRLPGRGRKEHSDQARFPSIVLFPLAFKTHLGTPILVILSQNQTHS